jgi:hypothetical protein
MSAHPRAVEIRQATAADLDLLTTLFDSYRQFYRLPSDPDRARRFLADRLSNALVVVHVPKNQLAHYRVGQKELAGGD